MNEAAPKKQSFRQRQLAKIHVAKKQLGLDEEGYRSLLAGVTGKESASAMSDGELGAVLRRFEELGFKPTRPKKTFPGRPRNMDQEYRSPLLHKIEALLADAKLPWSYADAIAQRMYGVQKVQWLKPPELRGIVAALYKRNQKKGLLP